LCVYVPIERSHPVSSYGNVLLLDPNHRYGHRSGRRRRCRRVFAPAS
jgi:hypothetical protein